MIKEDLILYIHLPNIWNQLEHAGHGHFPSMVLWQHWNQKKDRTSLQSTKNWLFLDLNWLKTVQFCLSFLVCYLLWIWHPGMWIMAQISGTQAMFNHFQPWVKLWLAQVTSPGFPGQSEIRNQNLTWNILLRTGNAIIFRLEHGFSFRFYVFFLLFWSSIPGFFPQCIPQGLDERLFHHAWHQWRALLVGS